VVDEAEGEGKAAAGPLALAHRQLAPDLTRGVMLLFIALANAHIFLHTTDVTVRGYPTAGSPLDLAVTGLLTVFVDGRAYPLFAALFGYGLVRICARQREAGRDEGAIRRLLRRRGAWMMPFGCVHAALLFPGDILATYGLLAVVFVGALQARERRLLQWGGLWLVLGSAFYVIDSVPMSTAQFAGSDPLTAILGQAAAAPLIAVALTLPSAFPFLVGVVAGRRGLLERPERHLPLLRRTALAGITAATLGGIPMALLTAQVWQPATPGYLAAGALHTATGYLGGFGYAAAIALLALRIADRRGPVVTALAASGQRSMTCYLSQSVVWVALFPSYTLDLGSRLGVAATALISTATWLLTVVLADGMRRAGIRGPAETLLRRLTYGAPRQVASSEPSRTRLL
jgi:uncharacterized protein